MTAPARYIERGDNSILRLAIYEVWGPRCYWCQTPRDFTDMQIDHIIPKKPQGTTLKQALRAVGKPETFDINSLANLAPICTTCNGRGVKGSRAFAAPRLMSQLAKAERCSSAVRDRVASFGASSGIARHLIDAAAANLKDPNVRRAYADHAPAVVQRLALLDAQLIDVLTRRAIRIELNRGDYQTVGLALDEPARAIVTMVENVCGSDLSEGLGDPIRDLIIRVYQDVKDALEAGQGPSGPRNAGEPEADYFEIEIQTLTCDRDGTLLRFTAAGSFESSLSASVVQDSSDGSELDDLQGDAWVSGSFNATFSWEMTDPNAGLNPGECSLTSWHADLSL